MIISKMPNLNQGIHMLNIKLLPVGETLPINQELAGLVPMASEAEQASLTADIKANGLREPVVLWHGEIVDGRCRQLACTLAGKAIMAKELDDALTEAEVRIFVKSVNTRRNLTHTQKVMSACRESLRPNSDSIHKLAKAWGISKGLLDNARFIARSNPTIADALFNGDSVNVIDSTGKGVVTNKVSTVYAFLKRLSEAVTPVESNGWQEDTYITTQAGKDWYYSKVATIPDVHTRMLIAELANYKFVIKPIT